MIDENKKSIDIYNQIAEDYAKTYDPMDSESDLIFLTTFLDYLQPGNHLIDLGCGTGFSAGWFTKKGLATEGCDLSSSMIDIAKRNYPNLSFSVSDMRTYEPQHSPDAVWAGYSMFHFDKEDFVKTIQKISSYLKPKGIFGLVMQEGEDEVYAPEPFLPNEKIYIRLYQEDELREILNSHGFEVLKVKRKEAKDTKEFSYNKLLVITRLK